MFSTLRTRFGIPGVISVMALVFAMFGGAYAASNTSGGGKATASAKAKKGPRGPKGAKGDTGPAGPAGPQGPAGAKGDAGANGSNGAAGEAGPQGPAGTSVVASSEPSGSANCEGRGGSKFVTGATTTFACNGEDGTGGGGGGGGLPTTLGSGETETGAWWIQGNTSTVGSFSAPISFPIPLSADDAGDIEVHIWSESDEDPACTGTPAEPSAPDGALCVYITESTGNNTLEVFSTDFVTEGVGTGGALLYREQMTVQGYLIGSFAITAP